MKTIKILFALMVFSSLGLFAQQSDYTKEAGYFDYSASAELKNLEVVTEVFLEEPMLKMIAKMAEGKKDAVENLIGALKMVKVNEYSVDDSNKDKVLSFIESMDKSLKSKAWERIVKTKKKETVANIYVKKGNGDNYEGLFVAALEGKGKLALVNIVGDINLETLSKISGQLNIPDLNKLGK